MALPEIDELIAGMLTGALVGAGAAMLLAPPNLSVDPLRAGPSRILKQARDRFRSAAADGRKAAAETRATLEHLST